MKNHKKNLGFNQSCPGCKKSLGIIQMDGRGTIILYCHKCDVKWNIMVHQMMVINIQEHIDKEVAEESLDDTM